MNHGDLPSQLLEQLPTQQTLNFEYEVLEGETLRVVQQRTNEIKTLMRRNSQDIIDIGQKLIEVKQHLGHGSFINWLNFEFNWSVSAATKFMQVAEQFKSVNFTHLNITASTLYLIAAPSTPREVREEVLERASNGENISYTKAKAIVAQYKNTKKEVLEAKTFSLKPEEPTKVTKIRGCKTKFAISVQEGLTEKDTQREMRTLSPLVSKHDVAFKDNQIAITTIATPSKDISDDTTQISDSVKNQVNISYETSDTAITEMAISIKNLTPEQLARVILKAANKGLSEYQLSAIITASQQVLNTRQQSEHSD